MRHSPQEIGNVRCLLLLVVQHCIINVDMWCWCLQIWGRFEQIGNGLQLVNNLMNIQGEGKKEGQESQVINLKEDEVQDEEESFGDLEDDNAAIQEEAGQRIVIDEDTMQSNDLLIDSKQPPETPPLPPLAPPLPVVLQPQGEQAEREAFYKGLINKLEEYSYDDQSLQPSYTRFEAEERKYLEQVKIIYCHFLIGDRPLSSQQFAHLRALLFVPKYGEGLVKWGNKKYEFSLTLPLALERLDHLERLSLQPKRRCRDDFRLLVMLSLLLIVIKLLS